MNLLELKDPSQIKSMNIKELNALAKDIRQFLIRSVSKTGGHLASNLGVVELTLALHYVFHSPEDKFLFDVGHQAYVHKILTGRAEQFTTLRKFNGLSGFVKRHESIHDIWEAGHSSTSLSGALGIAVARDLNHEHFEVIPIIGDGAIGNGMALEALNQIGVEKRKMIIIFNDNEMSISKNVGALDMGFSKLRASKGYNQVKATIKHGLRSNQIGNVVFTGLKSIKDSIKDHLVPSGIFKEFNIDYLGPVDGHQLKDLIAALQVAKEHDGPVVVHVLTKKGKGYLPCENDQEGRWHGVGPFNVETGKPLHSLPEHYATWGAVFADTVEDLAHKDEDIVAITPAMIRGSYLQKLFAHLPERCFDVGIAEEHGATFACGLALAGKKPYYVVYSSFLQRCYDQINHDICRMDVPVVLGIDHAGIVGDDGETHQGLFDIGLLTGLPNMILAQPSNVKEAKDLLYTAFHQQHPFGIRFIKGEVYHNTNHEYQMIPIGSWTIHHDDPSHLLVIFTYGEMVEQLVKLVEENQYPVTIVNCRFFKPIDEEVLYAFQKRNMHWCVYESDYLIHGLSSQILCFLNDHNFDRHIDRFGYPDVYIEQGNATQIRQQFGLDLEQIIAYIEAKLER